MAGFDFSWFKITGLAAAQHAASAVLTALTGNAINIWDLDFQELSGLGLGAAVVAVLGSIVTYRLPGVPDLIGVPTGKHRSGE